MCRFEDLYKKRLNHEELSYNEDMELNRLLWEFYINQDVDEQLCQIITANNITSIDRPYTGQPHTSEGVRGKTLVEGLTMRDIDDCMAMGLLEASGIHELYEAVQNGTWTYKDLYKLEDFDPIAAIQCMGCRLEKMMGIYPNVSKLTFCNDDYVLNGEE